MHSIPLDEEEGEDVAAGLIGPAMDARSAEEMLGDLRGHVLAGRYVLFELLASGELGCVYAGRDQPTGQIVTVKVLAASPEHKDVVAAAAERARQRFGIRHPHVAAVLAEGTLGTLWYAVMEHVTGQNFYHAHGDPRLDGAGLPTVAAQLAEGLAALHAAGAVHGAVSPGNLVWDSAGVRLVDLEVRMSEEPRPGEPGPGDDVRALVGVILELGAGREREPWLAALAPVGRGEVRPSAAELATQLRGARVEAPLVIPSLVIPNLIAPGASTPSAPIEASESAAAPIEDVPSAPPPFASMTDGLIAEPAPSPPPEVVPGPAASLTDAVSQALFARAPEPTPQPEPPAPSFSPAPAFGPAHTPAPSAPAPSAASSQAPVQAAFAEEDDDTWSAPVSKKRGGLAAVLIGAVVVAIVCAVAAWQLQAWNAAREQQLPPPVEIVPKRVGLAQGTSSTTLARAAAVAEPPSAEPASPEPSPAAEPAASTPALDPEEPKDAKPAEAAPAEQAGEAASEQLSAADFRRVMLRASRTQAVSTCFERHGDAGWPDVEVVALIAASGRPQRVRIGEGDLADCLRKVVLGLEFPRAKQSAQHNFVFHRPR